MYNICTYVHVHIYKNEPPWERIWRKENKQAEIRFNLCTYFTHLAGFFKDDMSPWVLSSICTHSTVDALLWLYQHILGMNLDWVWRHYAVPDYVHIKSNVFQGRTAWDIWPQIFFCSWIDPIWIPDSYPPFFKFNYQITVILEFQICSLPLSLLVSVPLSFPVSLYFYPWITTSTYASW
jgi:hypothetical protein